MAQRTLQECYYWPSHIRKRTAVDRDSGRLLLKDARDLGIKASLLGITDGGDVVPGEAHTSRI